MIPIVTPTPLAANYVAGGLSAHLVDDPRADLTILAHQRLVDFLNRNNPTPVTPKTEALLIQLLSGLTRQAFGRQKRRRVYALQTATGKTQAIVAWVSALHSLGLVGKISILIFASRVEDLCDLRRQLEAAGVPRSLIGLRHSKQFNPNRRDPSNLPEDHASEPADPDAMDRPILLATHSKARGVRSDHLGHWRGRPRDLAFWDETFFGSVTASLSLHDVRQVLHAAAKYLESMPATRRFLDAAKKWIEKEIADRKDGGPITPIYIIPMDLPDAQSEIDNILQTHLAAGVRAVLLQLKDFVELMTREVAVAITEQGPGIVTFRPAFPESLNSVAVLDASYSIRHLCALDKSLELGIDGNTAVKRYDDVTINCVSIGCGRSTVERDLQAGRMSRFLRLLAEVVSQLPPGQGLLIFTFCQRMGHRVNFKKIIRETLRSAGVDPDEVLPGTENMPRFPILTWGNETSISRYSYCENIFLLGVMVRSQIDLAATAVGQLRDLGKMPSVEQLRQFQISEIAHLAYQAMNRGSARLTDGGQAKPMNVWLPVARQKEKEVRALIEQVMPGVKWITAQRAGSKQSQSAQIIKEVADYLRRHPASEDTVSVVRLKSCIPSLRKVHPNTATSLVRMAGEIAGWRACGRSLVRTPANHMSP